MRQTREGASNGVGQIRQPPREFSPAGQLISGEKFVVVRSAPGPELDKLFEAKSDDAAREAGRCGAQHGFCRAAAQPSPTKPNQARYAAAGGVVAA